MKHIFLLILATLFWVNVISGQDNKPAEAAFNKDPEKAQIVTSDIALFWRAYDLAKPENNLVIYLENYKPQMLASFKKLKEIYPDAVFPNVYFIVGRMNAGGTVTFKGLLIGIDMYGKTDDVSL